MNINDDFLACGLALLASGQAMAVTCTTVAGGGAWNDFPTWVTSTAGSSDCLDSTSTSWVVPDTVDDVIIPSTTAVTGVGSMVAKTLTINGGGKFDMGTAGNTLTLSGNFTNNASAATDVVFTGSASNLVVFDANATVGGSAVTTFQNLRSMGGTLTLPASTIIADQLRVYSPAVIALAGNSVGGSVVTYGTGLTGTLKLTDADHSIQVQSDATISTVDTSLFTGTTKRISINGTYLLTITNLTPPTTVGATVSIKVGFGGTLTVTNAPAGATCTSDAAATGTQVATSFPVTALAANKTLVCTKNVGGGGGGAVSAPIFSLKDKPVMFSEELK